jgi:glycosyltransferase involved in cell wall biosynthesis
VLYLGNIVPHKGLDVLVRAIGRLPHAAVHLEVAGLASDDKFFRSVRELVDHLELNAQVCFQGRVTDGVRGELLRSCHVLAVPSYHEGYGLAIVEAMGYGLPVIAPTSGGAGEIVTDRQEGFLVRPGDVEGTAAHLDELRGNEALRNRMSESARRRFNSLPTWSEEMDRARAYLLDLSAGRYIGPPTPWTR